MSNKNKICVIGAGYVGLVAAACFADMGNKVFCVDNNCEKINLLQNCTIPIYEPGLEELIKSNLSEKRLVFTTDTDTAVKNSDICFIAVGTPQLPDGSPDLSDVFDAAKTIAKSMNGYKVIVNKSTVPVGTIDKITQIFKKYTTFDFDVVSNPEFLKQGNAVEDFLSPDRIIIGADSDKAVSVMQEIYSPFFRLGNRIIVMDIKSAELSKYASNSFLATKISFMNEIANLCEKVGADIQKVRQAMSSDTRIGGKYLFAGIGYGGSCFPKDVKALINTGEQNNLDMKIIKAADSVNSNQTHIFVQKILKEFNENLTGKTFAVWGLSFKPKTNDMRNAPSVNIINELLKYSAKIKVYDPKAMNNAKDCLSDKVFYAENSYDALKDADALLLLTEWNEFRHPDFEKVKSLLKTPAIFDGRNQYDGKLLNKMGFKYYSIGNKH